MKPERPETRKLDVSFVRKVKVQGELSGLIQLLVPCWALDFDFQLPLNKHSVCHFLLHLLHHV